MALFIKQNDERSKLQERLAAELQERAKKKAQEADLPDHVKDSRYMEGTKQTTSLAWAWLVIAALAIAALIYFVIITSTKNNG